MRTKQQEGLESFDPGDNVLVLSPPFSREGAEICSELVSHDGNEHVLCVTFASSPENHLMNWRRHGIVPDYASFVNVGANDTHLDSETTNGNTFGSQAVETTVDHVGSVENLTKLGVRMTNRLEEIVGRLGDHQTYVCFDSVTELLQYVETDQAFKFLHVVTDQITESHALGHFHMDPHAHDEETIKTLRTLFDDVVDIRDGTSATEST